MPVVSLTLESPCLGRVLSSLRGSGEMGVAPLKAGRAPGHQGGQTWGLLRAELHPDSSPGEQRRAAPNSSPHSTPWWLGWSWEETD